MAAPFDIENLVQDILKALNGAINDDITKYVDFAKGQSKLFAKRAAWIAEATILGEFDDDAERDWFLDDLKKDMETFARTVAALTILTIEKAWNAIVGTIWNAINGALSAAIGITLPVPGAPRA